MKKILAMLLGLTLTLAVLFLSFENPFETPQPTAAPTTPTQSTPTGDTGSIPHPGFQPTTQAPTQAPEQPTAFPVDPTQIPVTQPPVIDLPTSAILLTEQAEQSNSENSTAYFTYLYPNVRLYLTDEAVSQRVMLDLLNRIDSTRSQADGVRQNAANSGAGGYFYQLRYVPQRIDTAILSLSGVVTSYAGGAHPESTCIGVTYDLFTGQPLTLADILTEQCTAEDLCRMVVDILNRNKEELVLYADFSLSVEDRFSGNYLADECWYLSQRGLCFTFEPYEIGPYASGIVTAEIPYNMLIGFLNDAYFPAERIGAHGDLTATAAQDSSMDDFSNLIEVNIDPDKTPIVIHTQGLVYDLIIQTAGPEPTVVFMADQLTPGSAIVLRSATPNLQILYFSGNESHTVQIPNA